MLLNETSKLLEKIIASHLIQNLKEVGPSFSEAQLGFKVGRSTRDILNALKIGRRPQWQRDVLFAISLDVINGFSSLPFETLKLALRY